MTVQRKISASGGRRVDKYTQMCEDAVNLDIVKPFPEGQSAIGPNLKRCFNMTELQGELDIL